MKRIKALLKRLFCLPAWATILIAVPSYIFVGVILVMGGHPVLTYLSYILSAYALIITITGIGEVVRALRRGLDSLPLLKSVRKYPLGARLLDDKLFRTELSLFGSFLINFVYIFIKLFSGIYYRSIWYIALAAYYVFLTVIRFTLLHHVRLKPIGQEYVSELKRYRTCGILLLVLNLALSGIVTLVVIWNQGFTYASYLIYVMAMYAFYSLISAIINVVKFRKYNSPVLSAAKAVSLTSGLVSMLSLETAMLSQFGGENDVVFRRTMTATTGFVVCVTVLTMAVFMLRRASRELRQLSA